MKDETNKYVDSFDVKEPDETPRQSDGDGGQMSSRD
jgi:hypothetical protein